MKKNRNRNSLLVMLTLLGLSVISCKLTSEFSNDGILENTINDLPHYISSASQCKGSDQCDIIYKCYSKFLRQLYYGGKQDGSAYFNGSIDEYIDYELLVNCALQLTTEGNKKAEEDLLLFYKNKHRYATVGDTPFVAYSSNSYYYSVLSRVRGEEVLNVILLLSQDSVCDDGGHGDDFNNRSLEFLKSILPEVIVDIDGQEPNNWIWQRDEYAVDFLAQGPEYGGCREDELRLYRYKLKRAQANKLINFRTY